MEHHSLLDTFDYKILNALEQDGKRAFSKIAKDLGISNTMVHQRVARMKELGIIRKTTIQLDEQKLGYQWGAFTGLVLKDETNTKEIIAALKKIPEVLECYYITGSYTLFIRVVAKDNQHMREVIYGKLDKIKGIVKTESMIQLGCAFKRNVPF